MEINVRLSQTKVYCIHVSSGKQAEIKGLDENEYALIILHLEKFGAVDRAKLHGKAKGFSGVAYSDKPMKMEEFHYGFEDVLDDQESRSVVEASRAALASDMLQRDPVTGERLSLKGGTTETEVIEENTAKGNKPKRMRITVDPNVGRGDSIPLQ